MKGYNIRLPNRTIILINKIGFILIVMGASTLAASIGRYIGGSLISGFMILTGIVLYLGVELAQGEK